VGVGEVEGGGGGGGGGKRLHRVSDNKFSRKFDDVITS